MPDSGSSDPYVANPAAHLAACLPLLGHRNWIAVVDSAYPLQSRNGIQTMMVDRGQIELLQSVLGLIETSIHVRPIVYVDAELDHVREEDAPGVSAYRNELDTVLSGASPRKIPHDQIIAMLDSAAQNFQVVILKTTMTIPYTSVFLQLDCKYWSEDAESRLRQAFAAQDAQ